MKIRTLRLLLFLVFLSGCGHKNPINLTIAKERVMTYYEGGHYYKDMRKIVSRAIRHFAGIQPIKNETVIFDIDDTILSSYADQKEISFGFIPKLFHEWVMQADTPLVPEIKRLYDYLIKRNFKIIFLTSRRYDEYDATIKNLKLHGFDIFERLIVRQPEEFKINIETYKSTHRKKLTEEGYRIVGTVGDQWSDLNGGYSGHKVKLPNYGYLLR